MVNRSISHRRNIAAGTEPYSSPAHDAAAAATPSAKEPRGRQGAQASSADHAAALGTPVDATPPNKASVADHDPAHGILPGATSPANAPKPAETVADTNLTEAAAGSPAGQERKQRKLVLAQARRELVLDAARDVFAEKGLDGSSMREIARRAGYTPGALYSYFDSKEALYAALLADSLQRLGDSVSLAQAGHGQQLQEGLRASALGLFDFYQANPRDLDLGFYLFQGLQPRGLTPELNARLNNKLQAALLPIQHLLIDLGLSEAQARAKMTSLFAHAMGLLLLDHTGRIRLFRQEARRLFVDYLNELIQGRSPLAQNSA